MNMKISILQLLLIFLIVVANPVNAQNDLDGDQPIQENEEAEDRRDDPPKPQRPATQSNPRDEVFIPTEEISEDKPVAFPVDI